ncbi:hypothetical protein K8I61_02945 [bacterium]|nr:hypothetical protein [bacterium]
MNTRSSRPAFLAPDKTALAVAASIVFAIGAWAWWVSFDRLNTVGRPHFIIWDFICDLQAERGVLYPQGPSTVSRFPMHEAALLVTGRLGSSLAAITAVQLPCIVVIILSAAAIAGRLAGRWAAALAAVFAALGPMTVGLATSLDDLLALQASAIAAVALWLGSHSRRLGPVGILSIVPVAFGVSAATWISTALNFMLCVCLAGAGAVAWAWLSWWREGRESGAPVPWALTASVAASVSYGLSKVLPLPTEYLREQAARPRFDALAVANNPSAAFACVAEWFVHQAGPALAVVTIVSVVLAARRRRTLDTMALAAWLVLPMVVFTLISKRHAFYFIAAAPATYPLAAIGFAWIENERRRVIASVCAVAAVLAGFFVAATADIRRDPHPYFSRVFEGEPFPYLFSPKARKPWQEEVLGSWAAKTCEPLGLPLHIATSAQHSGPYGIEVFLAAPDMPYAHLESRAFFHEGHCLFIYQRLAEGETHDLSRALEGFARWRSDEPDPNAPRGVQGRLAVIRERTGDYRLVDTMGEWAVWAFEGTRAGLPPM